MFKKAAVLAVALVLVAGIAVAAYDLGPADYITTDFDAALPEIVSSFSISPQTSIDVEDLALLDLFYSDNQMLAWQAALAEGPITTWMAVDALTYHAFEKDGDVGYTPKKDRTLVTVTKRIILHLFFELE